MNFVLYFFHSSFTHSLSVHSCWSYFQSMLFLCWVQKNRKITKTAKNEKRGFWRQKVTLFLPEAAKNFTAKTERDVIVKVNRPEHNLLCLENSPKIIHYRNKCKYWLIILQYRFLLCTLFDTFSCRFSNICKQKWRFFPRKLKKCEFYRIDQEFFDILSNFLLTNRLLFLPRKFKHFDKRNEDFTDYPERVFAILQKYSHT